MARHTILRRLKVGIITDTGCGSPWRVVPFGELPAWPEITLLCAILWGVMNLSVVRVEVSRSAGR